MGPAVGAGEHRPLGLAIATTRVLEPQTVDSYVVLVEASFVTAHAVLVNGECCNYLLEGATIGWVPLHRVDLLLGDASSLKHCSVVEHRYGVEVLWQTVLGAVWAGPQLG